MFAAYKEMVRYSFAVGWSPATIRATGTTVTKADFAPAVGYMTPTCRADFLRAFAAAKNGSKKDGNTVEALQFINIHSGDLTPITGPGQTTDLKFSPVRAEVDNSQRTPRLGLTLRTSATVHGQDTHGNPGEFKTSRTSTYYLVPNPDSHQVDKPWLIDAFSAHENIGDPID